MRRSLKTALVLLLALLLAAPAQAFWIFGGQSEPTPVPAFAEAKTPVPEKRETDDSALVRVQLKSLEQPVALGLTLSGVYSVENDPGFSFDRDTELAVAVDGTDLVIKAGGLTLNMGESFTLTRHAAADGQENGIRIHETKRENLYLGDLKLTNIDGAIHAIVTLDVEDYLYGVVPYEMSDSFPLEALKAQAVAARTYVMSKKAPAKAYDVVDTPTDQVFRGFDIKCENTIQAVNATRGVVGLYKEKYAACYFTASNGGQTALPNHIWGGSGDYGWLDVRDDPYDLENPSSIVKSLVIPSDPTKLDKNLRAKLRSGLTETVAALGYSDEIGDIKILKIVSAEPTDPQFGEGNRMFQKIHVGMQVEAKKLYAPLPTPDAKTTPLNQVEVVPETLYADLDFYGDLKKNYDLKISPTDCEVAAVVPLAGERAAEEGETADAFRVESRRFGHGVGMSQRGAQQMANAHGAAFTDILAFYYPGMTLVEADYAREPLKELRALGAALGKARPRPTPKPTPAPLPALASGERYARVTLGSKSSTLNVRETPGTDGKLLGTLDSGQRLIIVAEVENNWAQIKTSEIAGYVSMDYLTKE